MIDWDSVVEAFAVISIALSIVAMVYGLAML